MNTYSSRPFTSHDGADEHGVRAEVKVVTGLGMVKELETSSAGKAKKVSFAVENTKFFPAGWAQVDSPVLTKVEEAQAADEPIHFRIETRRQAKLDRKTPIAELGGLANAKDSIVKSLAAVKREGDAEWTVGTMVTRFDEDPSGGNGVYLASDMASGGTNNAPATQNAPAGQEPPPYVTFNRAGELNPGSIAVGVLPNLLTFLAEWDRDHDETSQVGEQKKAAVAKLLLIAANELQLAIFDGKLEHPDLSAGSHSRARALLFEVMRTYYPVNPEVLASKESMVEWKDAMVKKSLAIWQWSMKEVESLPR